MVYEWEAHKETCYRLYIEEKKPLEDIVEYMRVHHNFKPSKRAFQTQFRKWDFPHKQNPAHKNDQLVERVRELWGRNLPQREMLRILNEEDGFDIKPRELIRLRSRNRWLLRAPNPGSAAPDKVTAGSSGDGDLVSGDLEMQQPQQQYHQLFDTDTQVAREERRRRLEAESAERWASKKRRRRTRAWAGMPPDPEGLPPRFPSETTLDESKAVLDLDRSLYQRLRSRFREICAEEGIERKTVAGPGRWERAKERLVAESAHLQAVMWTSAADGADDARGEEARKLALDVLCTDVTKRMRAGEPRLTIAEAKNILVVNPEESRQVRGALYEMLREDGFLSKLEDGAEHWERLKARWLEESDILQGKLAACEDEADHEQKRRAIETIARDIVKRFRDDQTRRNPAKKGTPGIEPPTMVRQDAPVHIEITPADMAALANTPLEADSYVSHLSPLAMVPGTPDSHAHSPGVVPMPMQAPSPQGHLQHQRLLPHQAAVIDPQTGLPMDPTGLLLPPDAAAAAAYMDDGSAAYAAQFAAFHHPHHQQRRISASAPATPVYLRLHPDSGVPGDPGRPWIAMLVSAPSVAELRHVAAGKYPGSVCTAVEAVLKTPKGSGGSGGDEVPIGVGSDAELGAYLASPFLEGNAPTFNVRLDYEY